MDLYRLAERKEKDCDQQPPSYAKVHLCKLEKVYLVVTEAWLQYPDRLAESS